MQKNYFYPIKIPLTIIRNDLLNYETIYLTSETTFPIYQLKYFYLKSLISLNNFDNNETFSNINATEIYKLYSISNTTPVKNIKQIDFYPLFNNIPQNNLLALRTLIQYKPFLYNYYYMMAEISRLEENYADALNFYNEGVKQKELYCYLSLARIYIEPGLIESYNIQRSPQKTLDLLLESFNYFGLFDKPFESFIGLYLLYLYYDSFLDFKNLILSEKTLDVPKSKLLDLLINIDFLKDETFDKFQLLRESSNFNKIILGDLLQETFFGGPEGLSLKLYEEAFREDKYSLYASIRVYHEKKKIISKSTKESLSKVFKSTILRNKALIFSQELLYYQLLEDPEFHKNHILTDYTISQANRLLEFGDYGVLLPLFRLFKHKEKSIKKGDDLIEKQQLQQKLYEIALKLMETDAGEFKEGPLAYCLEKAKGCNRDFQKSFELYEGLLKKTLKNRLDSFFFTYRLGSLMALEKDFIDESQKLSELAFRKVLRTLKVGINNITSLYDLAKIYRRRNEKNLQKLCYQYIIKVNNIIMFI